LNGDLRSITLPDQFDSNTGKVAFYPQRFSAPGGLVFGLGSDSGK
jgi:hypothetical protein